MDAQASKRAALLASLALLAFGALTSLALVGWIARQESLWSWKSILAAACALVAIATSALMWRAPSRLLAVVGMGAMLLSLARIGAPEEWTWVSFALVAVTFILLMPLVHAAIVLRDDA